MFEISSSELKGKLGEVIDRARREPVRVKTRGRSTVVIVDCARFDRLEELEDAYWIARAREAIRAGCHSPEESMAFLIEGMEQAEAAPGDGG